MHELGVVFHVIKTVEEAGERESAYRNRGGHSSDWRGFRCGGILSPELLEMGRGEEERNIKRQCSCGRTDSRQ